MNSQEIIRILIADDHMAVREGLAALLGRQPDLRVVAQAASGREAIELCRIYQPDVALIDLRMPTVDGVDVLKTLQREQASVRIIVLTGSDAEEDIYATIRAGAKAYLLKDSPADLLLETVRSVARGDTVLQPAIAAKLAERMSRPELTPREVEVLRLIATGRSNQEIGSALFITEGTVKSHVNSLLAKLRVEDRTQAVIASARLGLVRLL